MSRQLDVDGAELERFRDYLMLLSRLQLGPQMHGRLEASDLVPKMSLAQTAAALNRSQPSVAGLLRRGLRELRRMLDEPPSSGCRS